MEREIKRLAAHGPKYVYIDGKLWPAITRVGLEFQAGAIPGVSITFIAEDVKVEGDTIWVRTFGTENKD